MNEKLIADIREAIKLLEQEKQELIKLGQSTAGVEQQLNIFARGLEVVSGQAKIVSSNLASAERQYAKFLDAIKTGNNLRINLPGAGAEGTTKRYRTGQFIKNYNSASVTSALGALETEQEVSSVLQSPMASPTTTNAVKATTKTLQQVLEEHKKATLALDAEDVQSVNLQQRRLLQQEVVNMRRKDQAAAQKKQARQEAEDRKQAARDKVKAERDAQKDEIRAQKEADALKREQDKVRARQNLGSMLPGGQEAFDRLNKYAQAVDRAYTPENIKSVRMEPTTGISSVVYETQTAEGVFKTTTFTVDKFGRVLTDTQKRFRSFGDSIARNVGEFIKWSLAMTIVLGPLAKIGEMTQLMIKNESALADATITLGNAQKSANEIFAAATEIAQATGEETNKVLEAYNLAYRATGEIADETERFTTANKLLADALTLASLSGMDESTAIDTLSAAIKQSTYGLSDGSQLLDKWVAVSKVANVDINTLATSFATVGDAANTAGVSADKLNAVIATIAETSNQSGQEVANTARALIAGFQSDQGKKALANLGISAVTTDLKTGKEQARGFLDIMQQISDLSKKGIIDKDQLSSLTLALGGGYRRQASFDTFIKNFDKIGAIEEASNKASGDAAAALGTKLDTVEKASTRLGNSFQSLAQALGENGGLLDIFKGTLNTLNALITAMSKLMEIAGKAGPVLLATLGTAGYLGLKGDGYRDNIVRGISGSAQSLATRAFGTYNPDNSPMGPYPSRANGVGSFVSKNIGTMLGVGEIGIAAVQNLAKGENTKAIGDGVGGAIGLAIGSTFGPMGTAIGASIGTTIGESFVTWVENYKPKAENLFASTTPEGKKKEEEKKTGTPTAIEQGMAEVEKLLGGKMGLALQEAIYSGGQKAASFMSGNGFSGGYTREQAAVIALEQQRKQGRINEADYNRIIKFFQEAAKVPNIQKQTEAEVTDKYNPLLVTSLQKEQEDLLNRLVNNKIGKAAYTSGTESLGGYTSAASQYFGTFGNDYMKTQGVDAQKFFDVIAKIKGEASADQTDTINLLTTRITELDAEMGSLDKSTDEYNQKSKLRNQLTAEAVQYTAALYTQLASQADLLSTVDLTDYTKAEAEKIGKEAQAQYKAMLEKQVELGVITVEEMKAMLDKTEDILAQYKGGQYTKLENTNKDFIKSAEDALKARGELTSAKDMGFSAQDMTQSQYQQATAGYAALKKQLEGLGYKANENDPQIEIFKDGMTVEHRDQKIVQYLLQQIEKNTSKMEGAYNLPEGSSFWIPYEATKYMSRGGNATDLGTGTTPEATTTKPTDVAQVVTDALSKLYPDLTNKFREADKKSMDQYKTYASEQRQSFADRKAGTSEDTSRGAQAERSLTLEDHARRSREVQDSLSKDSGANSILEGLKKLFDIYSVGQQAQDQAMKGMGVQGVGAGTKTGPGIFDFSALTQALSNITTKLSLSIDNKTTVMLDGKVIAQAVKQYMKDDMVRYSGTSASKALSIL